MLKNYQRVVGVGSGGYGCGLRGVGGADTLNKVNMIAVEWWVYQSVK